MAGKEPNPFGDYPWFTKGFLVDTVTGERLEFQYNPEDFDVSKNPKWSSIEVPGLSHPKYQFINGGDKKIAFKLDFYRNNTSRGFDHIAKVMDWVESLTYPDFGENWGVNMQRGAHPVLFNFGELFKNFRCFLSAYSAKPEYLFEPITLLPLKASIQIELTELMYDPSMGVFRSADYRQIRNKRFGGGMANLQ